MEIVIKHQVNKCRECPYITNSSIEHNCPFTPEPYPTRWWCANPKSGKFKIYDEYKIDERCPEKDNCPIKVDSWPPMQTGMPEKPGEYLVMYTDGSCTVISWMDYGWNSYKTEHLIIGWWYLPNINNAQ